MWRLWVQALGLAQPSSGVIGGLLPNSTTLKDKAMGVQTLMINAPTMTLLAARAQNLHHHLRHRGHASLLDITASDKNLPWQSDKLPSPIKKHAAIPITQA